MVANRKYIVKHLGSLDENNPVIKFAFKLPSYCKVLSGISLFSPKMIQSEATEINAELSMWINDQKTPVGNCLFSLGYHAIDMQECRMVDVNQGLIGGREITGFVKHLGGAETFDIHLILECKM
jgi:hypothetical protein